ncbi:MAG: DUF3810 domain-containing protein [Eubacteriales bacterium]
MKKNQIIKGIAGLCSAFIPGLIFLFIPTLLLSHQSWSEYYSLNIFPLIARPFEFLSSLFPVSLTEILVVFAASSSIIWVVWLIYRFVHSVHKGAFLYRFILAAAIIFSVISISFTLLHGINYTRVPLDQTLSLDSPQRSPEELAEVTAWLAQRMWEMRDGLSEDSNGCMVLSTSLLQSLSDASRAMDKAALSFPVLSGTTVIAKPVALSHYWSYTGITGMYFPFFGEANVNVDVPDSQLPLIICHEISHTRGIAREQDANLAGFLACIYSDRRDFQYCAYQYAFLYCAWDLSIADETAYSKIGAMIPDSIRRDWDQNAAYWAQFEGPVQETSTHINDSYLQANLQEEGVKSYGRVTDLIVDYYFTFVKGN